MTALKLIFSEGFRAFFLSAGLFAVASVGLWTLWLAAQAAGVELALPVAPMPQQWHAHEMIFGYGAAALAGFFLTAVPNWTGARGAPHRFIATVWALWLAGRLAMLFSAGLPPWVVAAADLSLVPVLGAQMTMQMIVRPRAPQMIFVGLLALFWTANLLCHLEWMGLADTLWQGLRAGLLTLTATIVVMGGRVTPGFTRNAMVAAGREDRLPRNPAPLATVSIAACIATVAGYLLALPEAWPGVAALVAGAAALARVALWQGLWTRRQPILWTMHLSYALNALGLIVLGLSTFGIGTEIAALHVLGLGGVGGMTLAIMSRASLGHAGRPLVAPRGVAVAYALMPLALLARWTASVLPALYYPGVLTAGGLWIAAFLLYLASLWQVWWQPRAPRAPVGRPPK